MHLVTIVAKSVLVLALAGGLTGNTEAAPQSDPDLRPGLLRDLTACRALTASADRLACFDQAVDAFDAAERAGEVAVIDQEQARRTRQSLFGLDLNGAALFGRLRSGEPVEQIETTLVSAGRDGRGVWTFVLADGSTWRQVDREDIAVRVVPGAPVRIRQAAVGSFLLSVNGARSVRARRER